MAERLLTHKPEAVESLPTPEKLLALPTAEQATALRAGESDPSLRAEQARASIDNTPVVENPIQRLETAEKATLGAQPTFIDRNLKRLTLQRELKQLRRRLPLADRTLSHIIHQPLIRAVSETTAKTVSRPSGLLGGGLMALIGTSGYLYLAKHIGFSYNYTVFLLLLVAGWLLGLILELAVYSLTHHKDQ